MPKKQFIALYMTTFLSTYAANHVALPAGRDLHPVEEAISLATEAWERISKFLE